MREQRYQTLMLRLAGIRVELLMQLWRGGQKVQQENKQHQQAAQRQPAPLFPFFTLKQQSVRKLAQTGMGASPALFQ